MDFGLVGERFGYGFGDGRVSRGGFLFSLGRRRGFRGRRIGRALTVAGLPEVVADDVLPGIGAESADVLILGQMEGLDERLAEVGKSCGSFGFDLALGDGGEEASEGEAEVASGHIVSGKKKGDILAGFLASEGLRFLAGVEGAEMGMAVAARRAAAAAIGERERTQGRAVLGVIGGHGSLQKERFGILGEPRGSEAHF